MSAIRTPTARADDITCARSRGKAGQSEPGAPTTGGPATGMFHGVRSRTAAPAHPALALGARSAWHREVSEFAHDWPAVVVFFGLMVSAVMAVEPRITDQGASDIIAGLGADFRQQRSGHFTLAFDTSDPAAREVAAQMEATYGAVIEFCRQTGITINRPAAPLTTVLFNRRGGYEAFLRHRNLPAGESAGSFLPTANVAVFWNIHDHPDIRHITEQIDRLAADTGDSGPPDGGPPRERKERITALRAERSALVRRYMSLVVAHETAHQVLCNIGVRALGGDGPAWLVEGLACQFEVGQPRLADDHLASNPMRHSDYRTALGVGSEARTITRSQYREAIQSGRIVPLSELLVTDNLFADVRERSAYRYAQSWALVFYLHEGHGKPFRGFLRTLVAEPRTKARDAKALFQAAFGPMDDLWEITMASFVLSHADSPSGS